jgi:dihydrofolate synthase/folylpolyglutamate synthase
MKTCLLGRYQVHNAAVALAAIEALDGKGIRVPESAVRSGIERARWPARFQALSYNPPVILDGAHNPAGTSTLLSTLTSYFPDTRYVFLVGILKDKQYRKMLELLAAHSELMIFTKPDNPRACSPEELAEVLSEIAPGIPFEIHQSPSGALSRLMSIKGNNPKVICGSLYLAGDILKEAGNLL